ncbi:MAG: hypothetical protein OEY79_03590, partial [Anaplasmataceae bacterium]|nr:hypothetical protein [Anaplasmataceae bacterium]
MQLGFNISYNDLYSIDGMRKINDYYLEFLNKKGIDFEKIHKIENLSEHAIELDQFIKILFKIDDIPINSKHYNEIHDCKRNFIQRLAVKNINKNIDINDINKKAIEIFNQDLPISDIDFTNKVLQWLLRPNVCNEELKV